MNPEILAYGPLELNRASMVLAGPAGRVPLSGRQFLVLERLMRRPEALVSISDLVAMLYDGGQEPQNPEVMVRQQVVQLRRLIAKVGAGYAITIRTAVRCGYAIEPAASRSGPVHTGAEQAMRRAG